MLPFLLLSMLMLLLLLLLLLPLLLLLYGNVAIVVICCAHVCLQVPSPMCMYMLVLHACKRACHVCLRVRVYVCMLVGWSFDCISMYVILSLRWQLHVQIGALTSGRALTRLWALLCIKYSGSLLFFLVRCALSNLDVLFLCALHCFLRFYIQSFA